MKKQLYWWWKQYIILKNATAVCFTTEEERILARKTFWPYNFKEKVTGLGINEPSTNEIEQINLFHKKFPVIKKEMSSLYGKNSS